jgi:integral membrane protein
MRLKDPIETLRLAGLIEGASFLVLLFVAMPLKYFAGMPGAVKAVGWVHGVLFMLFCVALLRAAAAARWPLERSGLVLVAALLPFGPFVADRRIKRYAEEYRARQAVTLPG